MDEKAMREFELTVAGGLRLASRVRVQGIRPELVLGLVIVSELCRATAVSVLVTSVLDGEHMISSLHYTGAGADFISDLTLHRDEWVAELRRRLGPDFDVVDETTHIHIEYQPHFGAVTQENVR